MATQFSIVVNNGSGGTATVVIAIPNTGTDGPPTANQTGDILSLAQNLAKHGFWDSTQSNFYPSSVVLKITPQ
jgi:hypothetical protein